MAAFLQARLQAAADLGIAESQVVLDPGIGFGKTARNTTCGCWPRLDRLGRLGRPVCLGVSRKGFLGRLLNRGVEERLAGSLAVACHALAHGSAQIFRVHDVAATRDAITVFAALYQESGVRSQSQESGCLGVRPHPTSSPDGHGQTWLPLTPAYQPIPFLNL